MNLPACFRRSILIVLFFADILVLLGTPHLQAQSNTVDPVFGGAGLGLLRDVLGLCLQSDGELLVAGGTDNLARLHADGSTDTGFIANVGLALSTNPLPVIVSQSDGKVLVGGPFTQADGLPSTGLVRLNTDGSVDIGFDGSIVSSWFSLAAIALQSDGRILVGGFNQSGTGLVRLNTDGTVDPSFVSNLTDVNAVLVQNDSKLIVIDSLSVVRLNPDGTQDSTYQAAPGEEIFIVALQADGKVLAGGNSLLRLNTDGSLDTSFNYNGNFTINVLTVEANGQILIELNNLECPSLARLNTDGSVDTSFQVSADGEIYSVLAEPDNTILIGGPFTQVNGVSCNSVAHLSDAGVVDQSYTVDVNSGPNGPVNCIAVGSDGKVVIAGSFTQIDGVSRPGLARLTSSGTPDASFSATLGTGADPLDTVTALAVQADDKILLCGGFTEIDGVAAPGYARLNNDGTLDTTFAIAPLTGLTQIYVQPDGTIELSGSVTDDSGNTQAAVAQLNSDGSVNPTLTALPSGVTALAVQPDGNILAESAYDLVRYKVDGKLDKSFKATTPIGGHDKFIYCTVVEPNGQILVGGTEISVIPDQPGLGILMRFNADGTLDSTFQGDSLDGVVYSIVAAADGTLTIGGTFSQVEGQPRQGLAHLNADGTLDPFQPAEAGVSGSVSKLVQTASGNVLMGGNFTSIDGVVRNYVAELDGSGTPYFFFGNVLVGEGFYYLQFPNGNPFGYYNLAGNGYAFPYFYHADLGMEYFFDANDGQGGAYMYDFASSDFFYTSPMFPWPYLYDFTLNTVLYYYPDTRNPGHYTTNPRYFFNFATGQIITK